MCPVCGKNPVVVSDSRDLRKNDLPTCSRVCASSSKFLNDRYVDSGKTQRPTVEEMLERK